MNMSERKNIMQYCMPEMVGISSENVLKFIQVLEKRRFAVHSIILARGDKIFCEKYWEPFHKDYLHRMYSVSKSFVSLAIGFMEQDGLIHLDDKMSKYFSVELEKQPDQNLHNQTIRHMLMMSTAKREKSWFADKAEDRVAYYFANLNENSRPSGTFFEYDSTGSFVLGSLVERITGMSFMEYLRIKLFREIGVSEEAYCLKCPGGHSWTDSGIICKTMDLLLIARFVLNGGKWNGKQILNEQYITAAISKQISNNNMNLNTYNTQGYGYQIWRTWQDSFFFYGIGTQYAICVPHKDLILVINGGTHGKEYALDPILFDTFFELIEKPAIESALPEDLEKYRKFEEYTKELNLISIQGAKHSIWKDKIKNITYSMDKNTMGITRLRVNLEGDRGSFFYTNKQGDKEIKFGLGYNEFAMFPEEGYPDEVGNIPKPGNYYQCAASAAWVEVNKLHIEVQIFGKYFGNLSIILAFGENEIGVYMTKAAEFFLTEYSGFARGVVLR